MFRSALLLGISVSLIASATPAALTVTKGPVITGVTQHDAWISWETSGKEGCPEPFAAVRLFHQGRRLTIRSDRSCGTIHHVHLTHLRPGTRYTFTLDQPCPGHQAAKGDFDTAPARKSASFSFVVYGDNREPPLPAARTKPAHEAVSEAILRNEPDAAFLIHTGDLALNSAENAGPDRGYSEFFDVERALLSSRPIYAVVGNHETRDMAEYDALVNPRSFTPHTAHPYYTSMDWGRVHFVFLDSFEGADKGGEWGRKPGISDAQFRWIEHDLKAAHAAGQVIFIVTHQGPYSHFAAGGDGHGGSEVEQKRLVPLMRKYGVTAVLAGHDHYYEHGQEGCITYFVVGGGGAPMYTPDAQAQGVIKAVKTTSYLVIHVRNGKVLAEAKNVAGKVIDGPDLLQPASTTQCLGSPQAQK